MSGITGRWGFLQIDNIQSTMVGYPRNYTFDNSQKQNEEVYTVCGFTVDRAHDIPCVMQMDSCGTKLPKVNVKPHNISITENVKNIVNARYKNDVEMWNNVNLHGGILCWNKSASSIGDL